MFLKSLNKQGCLVVLCLILIGAMDSQAQVVYSASRHMTRSAGVALVHQFRHVEHALSGHALAGDDANVLPGRIVCPVRLAGATEEFVEYWGDKAWGSSDQKGFTNMHSAGGRRVDLDQCGRREVRVGDRPAHAHRRRGAAELRHCQFKEASWGIQSIVPNRGVGTRHRQIQLGWQGAAPQSADPANLRPYEIHNFDYGIYPPVENAGEEIHITQWQTKHDVVVTRKAHAWSHQDFDDFFILELEFENRGGQQLDDTYFGVMNSMYVNSAGTSYRWGHEGGLVTYRRSQALDDHYRYSEASNFTNNSLMRAVACGFPGQIHHVPVGWQFAIQL